MWMECQNINIKTTAELENVIKTYIKVEKHKESADLHQGQYSLPLWYANPPSTATIYVWVYFPNSWYYFKIELWRVEASSSLQSWNFFSIVSLVEFIADNLHMDATWCAWLYISIEMNQTKSLTQLMLGALSLRLPFEQLLTSLPFYPRCMYMSWNAIVPST